MTLSLDALRCFVAVAEEGHFGRAAERLRLTQPPLSRRIQALERSIGTPLLLRTARGADLTPAGRELLAGARSLLSAADDLPGRVRRVADGIEGRLRIGFTAAAAHAVLGRVLDQADAALPHVEVELGEHVSSAQITLLMGGGLDLGLLRPSPLPPGLAGRVIHRERLLVAAPADHALARAAAPVPVAALLAEPMITYAPAEAAYFADLTTAVLGGARPRSTQRVAQIHSMLSLVGAGRGVAIVPESAGALHGPDVALLELADPRAPLAELCAVHRADGASPAALRALATLPALAALPRSRDGAESCPHGTGPAPVPHHSW